MGAFPKAPVVLISIDTLRSDHLPAYGYEGVETPAIDAFRRDAILFERAYSHTPLTLPSHVSMLTGRLPTEHGVRDNVGYRYDGDRFPNLAAVLHGAGYATGAAVSAYVLRPETGMSHGFDVYDAGIPVHFTDSLGLSQRPGGQTADAALAWLKTLKAVQRPPLLPLPPPLRAAHPLRAARAVRLALRRPARTTARSPPPTPSSAGCSPRSRSRGSTTAR